MSLSQNESKEHSRRLFSLPESEEYSLDSGGMLSTKYVLVEERVSLQSTFHSIILSGEITGRVCEESTGRGTRSGVNPGVCEERTGRGSKVCSRGESGSDLFCVVLVQFKSKLLL